MVAPQGSVLGPLFFNIYLNLNEFNFADDTTTYICDKNLQNVLKSLWKESMRATRWFENSYKILKYLNHHLKTFDK